MLYNPLKSWTLRFILERWGPATLGSAIRWRTFLLREKAGQWSLDTLLPLRLRRPIKGDIWIRPHGTDINTLEEIVLLRVYDVVTERLQSCRYVIDVGGNIGLATRVFATQYKDSQILVVEPHPETYKLLEKNVAELVEEGRCQTMRAGVWGRKARLAVAIPHGREGCYIEAFVYETDAEDATVVDAVTMSELIERSRFPVVDLLKVDIEGGEVDLFRGDLSWLKQVRAIAIEFHGDSRERSGFDAIMEQYGFEVDDSEHHTVLATRTA